MRKLHLRMFRMIRNQMGQFAAVAAVIAVGLLMFTAMNMASLNLENSVNAYYESNRFADVYVELVRIPEKAVGDLLQMEAVEAAEGRIVQDVPLDVADKDSRVRIRLISSPPAGNGINRLYGIRGRDRVLSDDSILVVELFAKARGLRLQDPLKPHIGGRSYPLSVEGVVTTPEYIYLMENEQALLPDKKNFGVGFVSQAFAQRVFGFEKSFNQVLVKAVPGTNLDLLKDQLEKKLKKYGVKRIYTRDTQMSARIVEEEIKGNRKAAQVVPTIFLMVAASVMIIMVHRMVRNDRTSIGVFKAMGFTDRQIIGHYTLFSLLIGITGALPGLALGTWLADVIATLYASEFYNVPEMVGRVYPQYYAGALLLALVFCLGAGLWGARGVMEITPAEAMRPEAPRSGHRLWLEQHRWLWNRLSFTWKMTVRNISRSKRRFATVAFGIAITYAVTYIPLYLTDASMKSFTDQYTVFQTMDYTLTFSRPVGAAAVNDLKAVPGVGHVEPYNEFPFEVGRGWRSKVVNVIGLRQDTRFFHLKNPAGGEHPVPRKGVLISESLARILKAEAGDQLVFRSFIPDRPDKTFTVVGVVEQALGTNVYMDQGEMQRELLEPGWVTGAVLEGDAGVKGRLTGWKNILTVQSSSDLMAIFMEYMQLSLASISMMVFFSFILGFAIVYNSTMMTINERLMEFSSLRVLGFGTGQIFGLLLKENLLVTLVGLAAGIPLGWQMVVVTVGYYSNELYTFKAVLEPGSFINAGLLTLLFVVLAQGATYTRIRRLDFIEAIKNRVS